MDFSPIRFSITDEMRVCQCGEGVQNEKHVLVGSNLTKGIREEYGEPSVCFKTKAQLLYAAWDFRFFRGRICITFFILIFKPSSFIYVNLLVQFHFMIFRWTTKSGLRTRCRRNWSNAKNISTRNKKIGGQGPFISCKMFRRSTTKGQRWRSLWNKLR